MPAHNLSKAASKVGCVTEQKQQGGLISVNCLVFVVNASLAGTSVTCTDGTAAACRMLCSDPQC